MDSNIKALIKTDFEIYHLMLLLFKSRETLIRNGHISTWDMMRAMTIAGRYNERQALLKEAFKDVKRGYKKGYKPLVNQYSGEASGRIGVAPLLIIAVVAIGAAAVGYVGYSWSSHKAKADVDKAKLKEYAGMLKDATPEVQAQIIEDMGEVGKDLAGGGLFSGVTEAAGTATNAVKWVAGAFVVYKVLPLLTK